MSLWTPGGEHDVPDDRPGGGAGPDQFGDFGDIDPEQLTDEQRAQLEAMAGEMAQVRAQLQSVPASTVVANHVMGLYELAAIHLSAERPDLVAAALAIDAVACLVEGLGARLGDDAPTMRDALANIRLAFVQVKAAAAPPPPGDG